MNALIDRLLGSEEPVIRAKTLINVLDQGDSRQARQAREAVRRSERVRRLLDMAQVSRGVYSKFTGAHWVLADLADVEYPAGDEALIPVRDRVLDFWLDEERIRERVVDREAPRYKSCPGVPIIDGRARRCASQQGNALYAILKLGIADGRADRLAELLLRWQWPDGGWNCDRKAAAMNSSFMESLIPLRALALHGRMTGNTRSLQGARRAAEIFLKRHLYKRESDGSVMNEDFVKLHYPCYWHYDILFSLKVMAEAGFLGDERCRDALSLLGGKELPDGGYPAQGKYYKVTQTAENGGSAVAWGETNRRRMNEFVTVDALYVLKSSGALQSLKLKEADVS